MLFPDEPIALSQINDVVVRPHIMCLGVELILISSGTLRGYRVNVWMTST